MEGTVISPQEAEKRAKIAAKDREIVKGVGGWLLFFIITSVIGLLMDLRDVFNFARTGWDDFFTPGAVVFLILTIGADCFYGYCLVCLATVKRYAVRLIKLTLIAYPLFAVGLPLLMLGAVLLFSGINLFTKEVLSEAYNAEVVIILVRTTIRSLIWYAYFSVSVRVKNTWPEARPMRAEEVFG